MRIFAAIAIWLLACVGSQSATAFEGRIGQAVVAQDRLWFLENFVLWSADLQGKAATKHVSNGVVGLAKTENAVWIARIEFRSPEPGPGGTVRVHQVRANGELGDPALRLVLKPDEVVKGFFPLEGDVFVLTQKRLVSSKDKQQIVEPIAYGKARGRMVSAASPTRSRGEVFLGFDAGEWGGGVLRLDVREGRGKVLRSPDADALCDGAMNPNCQIGTAVIPDPDNGACILAALGSWHLYEKGSLVRVCPDTFQTVFLELTKDANSSTAFSGLAPAKTGFWAASARELFKFENGKLLSRAPLTVSQTPSGLRMMSSNGEIIVLDSGPPGARDKDVFRPILVSTLP